MNRVLYITKHNPWGIGGGSTASKMYLEAFRNVFEGGHIDLLVSQSIPLEQIPSEIREDKNISLIRVYERSAISKALSPLSEITHRYQQKALELLRTKSYTHCVFDHSSIAGTLINHISPHTKTVVIHHNYEPDYFRDNTTNVVMRTLLLPAVKHNERRAYLNCNVNIFLTDEDRRHFERVYGKNYAQNIVTGLFEVDQYQKLSPVSTLQIDVPTILITGSLNNVQNLDGIRFFISELYPLIPDSYKIIIAGRNPTDEIRSLVKDKANIELIPNPREMSDVIKQGNIFLSPARLGGGIKVRVTDGLKAGRPVIAHMTSARGYAAYIDKGYFKPFSTPEEFRKALEYTVEEINAHKYSSTEIAGLYKTESSLSKVVSTINTAISL